MTFLFIQSQVFESHEGVSNIQKKETGISDGLSSVQISYSENQKEALRRQILSERGFYFYIDSHLTDYDEYEMLMSSINETREDVRV